MSSCSSSASKRSARLKGRLEDLLLCVDEVSECGDGVVYDEVHAPVVHLLDRVCPVLDRPPMGVHERVVERRVTVRSPRHVAKRA